MNCKISVIVPVYNSEEYLHKCIDSILNQSFKDIELILVNDGSKDNSGNICDEYKKYDNRVKVIHIENAGVSNARNVGIENATGEYIVFSDSDDYVEYTWCEELYKVVVDRTNSLVVCGCKIRNERLHSYEIDNLLNRNSNLDIISKQDFFKLYTSNLLNSPCNKIFKRETLLKYNIRYDIGLSLGEDMLFNLEYLRYTDSNEIYVINKSLYNYILREHESLDNKYYEDLFGIYKKLYKELYDYMILFEVELKNYEKDYWTSYFYMLERVLKNTYSNKNNLSKIKKYLYNCKITKTYEFKTCINNIRKEDINRLYLMCLKTNNYMTIMIGFKLINLLSYIKCKVINRLAAREEII